MKCRGCENHNILVLPTCAHCGEPLPETPGTGSGEEEPAGRRSTHAKPRAIAPEWRCLAVSLATITVLTWGGVSTAGWLSDLGLGPFAAAAEPPPEPATEGGAPAGTPAAADPSEQAEAVNALLQYVRASRSKLPATLGGCDTLLSDLEPLREIHRERTEQAEQARNLETGGLPGGDTLRQALVTMTQSSLDADQRYMDWAENSSPGTCSDAHGYGSIMQANDAAKKAKSRFALLWKPVAEQYGYPVYRWDSL